MAKPVAWCLSAYRSDSHAYWADWLTRNLEDFEWRLLELPGRHFRWRIRGNPVSWLDELPAETPDLIIATSMVDLATLKGLHPRLSAVPCVYYFHENQFAYPVGEHQVRSIEPQMVQLYGALAADMCLFNSHYNMHSFLEGVDDLLSKMPDHVPADICTRLRLRSQVLPVAIDPIAAGPKQALILWNHRWEYDKDPDCFAEAMIRLAASDVEFELALLGARSNKVPDALLRLRQECPERIRYDARVDDQVYADILSRSRVVVSTAQHEFQGISVMQAVSAGAIPVVPDDLCYPEQYPDSCRFPADDLNSLLDRLQSALEQPAGDAPAVDDWYSDRLLPRWSETLTKQL